MRSNAATPEAYISNLPDDRKEAVSQLRQVIKMNLPKGFTEIMGYGMLGYAVPHSLYPAGYHCDPKLPLPFINLGSQKNFIAVYHMGLYADNNLLDWFTNEYKQQSADKLDMGKSCLRFKKPAKIPFALIGQLASKVTPEAWISIYEEKYKR